MGKWANDLADSTQKRIFKWPTYENILNTIGYHNAMKPLSTHWNSWNEKQKKILARVGEKEEYCWWEGTMAPRLWHRLTCTNAELMHTQSPGNSPHPGDTPHRTAYICAPKDKYHVYSGMAPNR